MPFRLLLTIAALSALCLADAPKATPDRTVTLQFKAPNAKEVTVAGDFGKAMPMVKDDAGVWSVTLGPLDPDIYSYTFRADGVSNTDPSNPHLKTGYQGQSSYFVIPGDSVWDVKPVAHGALHHHFYASKAVGDTRDFVVYTPPGYEESKAKLPVMYLLHGSGDLATGWSEYGMANFIMDNLLAQGKIKPMIVVMPFGHASSARGPENRYTNTDLFAKDLLGDVMPLVEKHYRTINDANHRAITGLSMGGAQAIWTGLNNLDKFAYVVAMSGASTAEELDARFAPVAKDVEGTNKKLKLLWISMGKEDPRIEPNQKFAEALKARGVKLTYVTTDGGHTWRVWRRNLAEFAPLLFR